ncbi:hypothetical protein Zmor_003853 [Zophobas morio]|uniref:Uncharacterized protein n=1 Tax=Zophobas morio TaxID=2755281 RepID=A0AA38HMT3_9CUCU|nr:hypothetical protein Zmor_003853 [Zophobas morio]
MAWQKVSEQTIANCFRHAGFLQCEEKFEPGQGWDFVSTDTIRYEAINDKDENINFRCERKRRPHFIGTDILSLQKQNPTPEDELLLAELLRKHESNSDDEFDIDFEEYVHFDDILVKSEILDDAAIVELVQCNIQTEDETEDDDDNEEEEEKEGTIPKPS